MRARHRDRRGQALSRHFPRAHANVSRRRHRRGAQAPDRAPLCRHRRARHGRDRRRLLDEPRPAVRRREAESREVHRSPRGDRRRRAGGACPRRSARSGFSVARRSGDLTVVLASDYLEERLDAGEPPAPLRRHAVAARPAFRHLPVGGAGLQAGRGRLLGVPCRADAAQPRDQGVPRPQRRPSCRDLAARARRRGPGRGPACGRRDRQGDRHRLPHRSARSRRQPRPHGLERRRGITSRRVRNARCADVRSCAIPAARRRRSRFTPAASS